MGEIAIALSTEQTCSRPCPFGRLTWFAGRLLDRFHPCDVRMSQSSSLMHITQAHPAQSTVGIIPPPRRRDIGYLSESLFSCFTLMYHLPFLAQWLYIRSKSGRVDLASSDSRNTYGSAAHLARQNDSHRSRNGAQRTQQNAHPQKSWQEMFGA
jgi:hypothetical protein